MYTWVYIHVTCLAHDACPVSDSCYNILLLFQSSISSVKFSIFLHIDFAHFLLRLYIGVYVVVVLCSFAIINSHSVRICGSFPFCLLLPWFGSFSHLGSTILSLLTGLLPLALPSSSVAPTLPSWCSLKYESDPVTPSTVC